MAANGYEEIERNNGSRVSILRDANLWIDALNRRWPQQEKPKHNAPYFQRVCHGELC